MNAIKILDSHISYAEAGQGDGTVVFLHGNPTTSYIWRDVIPFVEKHARVLAPDLIGMGDSGRPEIGYRFDDHARYLDAWFDALDLNDVILVGHDWGGSLAMDWAARHPSRVRSVVLLETFLRPMSWERDYPEPVRQVFKDLRTPGVGEQMVLEGNWFIESALRATNPEITDETLEAYRRAYPDPESRRPLLQWAREIPLDGEPGDVHGRFLAYGDWLANSPDVAKLLLTTDPGSLVPPQVVEWARENIAALEVESVGPAGHHAPEAQPDAIGQAIARWVTRRAK